MKPVALVCKICQSRLNWGNWQKVWDLKALAVTHEIHWTHCNECALHPKEVCHETVTQ